MESETPQIVFEEITIATGKLMQELASPEARKNRKVPFPVASQLRQHQITRIEENIQVLRRKQAEFNKKMEDYVQSLESLLKSLQEGGDAQADSEDLEDPGGTYVRCIGCGLERQFEEVHVLVALEPEDYLAEPTEVIVQKEGELKKGLFKCPQCGNSNMTIRPL